MAEDHAAVSENARCVRSFILCAVCKELDLALRTDRCYTNRGIVSMGTLAAVPLERRADRVGERPGASTLPPRATRRGQYLKRSVGSCGPTMRPGLTRATRPGSVSSSMSSQRALSAP